MSGGSSSGSSQSQGSGSSYSQSASVSMPYNMTSPYFQAYAPHTADALWQTYADLNQGNGNPILQSFLAPYGGQFSAPVTGAQNATLANLGSAEGGNFSFNPGLQQIIGQLTGEAINPIGFGQAVASGLAGPGSPTIGEGQFASNLATSPEIQKVIQAASAPITQAFASQTVPGLAGTMAQAGQRATGGGSSAFDMAFGNAQNNELAQLAGVGGQIAGNAYETGLQQYGNAYAGGLNAALSAPSQLQSLTGSEINQLIQTLNAQALPQLTEQLGINNALSTYNSSMSSMLQALGLQVQSEAPVIGYGSESVSNSGSFQNEESSGQQSGFNFSLPGLL